MISDWRTYSLEDFLPFTPEVYFRLIERVNEALWPMHLLMLLAGIAIIVLSFAKCSRTAGALTAVIWGWVGVSFLINRYAELNWAGTYFGWTFCIQGLLLFGVGFSGRLGEAKGETRRFSGPDWIGFIIAGYGLLVYPLLGPVFGGGWGESESFGIHPDPTAIGTAGILLVTTKGWSLWISTVIPILWCLVAGLTLWALEAPWAPALAAVALLALVGMVWRQIMRPKSET